MSDTLPRIVRLIDGLAWVSDTSAITESSRIVEDLALDSIDCVELQMFVEDEFDITVHDDEMDKVRTVGDLVALVRRKLVDEVGA